VTGLWLTVVLGGIVGMSGLAAWRFAFPPPTPLPVALARLQRISEIVDDHDQTTPEWKRALGRRALPLLEGFGWSPDSLRADARITGASLESHVGSKVTSALMPLVFIAAVTLLLATAGLHLPAGVVLALTVVSMTAGFLGPDLTLRKQAEERRRDFGLAFGSYLDLVAISLAGGMGTEAALVEAARIGDSWAFRLLGRAVDVAQIEGTTVWHTLGRLGEDLRVPALTELAASVALAGEEGARVRASIAVKADTLRALELAEAETKAQSATERMAVPTAMLLFGFVILIGFPAVMTVLGGI